MKLTLLAALALALGACEPNYAYLPVTNATVVRGKVAAEYPIPADMPHGDVRIASYGIADVGPRHPRGENDRLRALHLRFTIENNADRDWTFDTRQQRVLLQGYGQSQPAFVAVNGGGSPPVVTVPALQSRTIDLFFPLPAPLQRARQLPAFDVIWRVHAYDKFVARRTPFERVVVAPPPDALDYGPDYGMGDWWGPPYWYNPAYGWEDGFAGGVAVPRRYYGGVTIHRDMDDTHFMGRGRSSVGAPAQPHAR